MLRPKERNPFGKFFEIEAVSFDLLTATCCLTIFNSSLFRIAKLIKCSSRGTAFLKFGRISVF